MRASQAVAPATTDADQSITDVGLTTCLLIPAPWGRAPGPGRAAGAGAARAGPSSRPDLLGRQRLLQVEVEVAQRAGHHQAVGVGVDRVAEVAARHLQRGLHVHGDDREAAALVDAGVVDHGAAERLDDHVHVAVARVLLVDAQPVDGAHDVAAVEGAHLEVGERALDLGAQRVEADLLHQQPQQVLVGQAALVAQALVGEVRVDVVAVLGVGVQALLALGLRALAGGADVHHQLAVGLLGQREGARVERVGQLLVVLGDHAGAAAGGAVELDQLEVEQRRDLGHRTVQLRREPAAHAARPVGNLHDVSLSLEADSGPSPDAVCGRGGPDGAGSGSSS